MGFSKIAKKIEEMIKDSITSKGLVKSGKLLRSIKVTVDDKGTYSIKAEDYFPYLDAEHNILKEVFDSPELDKYIENVMTDEFNKALNQ